MLLQRFAKNAAWATSSGAQLVSVCGAIIQTSAKTARPWSLLVCMVLAMDDFTLSCLVTESCVNHLPSVVKVNDHLWATSVHTLLNAPNADRCWKMLAAVEFFCFIFKLMVHSCCHLCINGFTSVQWRTVYWCVDVSDFCLAVMGKSQIKSYSGITNYLTKRFKSLCQITNQITSTKWKQLQTL